MIKREIKNESIVEMQKTWNQKERISKSILKLYIFECAITTNHFNISFLKANKNIKDFNKNALQIKRKVI